MKNFIYLLLVVCITSACNKQENRPHLTEAQRAARLDSLRMDLLKTDSAFSLLSQQKGRNAAFTQYADSDAVMLRPYSMPVTGRDTIIKVMNNNPDTGLVLTWSPARAYVSRAGDMGYTYGTYFLEFSKTDRAGGTYCTIWKKDRNKQWKFVLSTGNEGVEPE